MKYIIRSFDARHNAKPFYREVTREWKIEEGAENIFFVSDRNQAARFPDVDTARRWAREILLLDIFSIEPVDAGTEPKLVLKGGVEITPEQAKAALDAAMSIIESVGTTGIYSRYHQAEAWMKSYYPNWS